MKYLILLICLFNAGCGIYVARYKMFINHNAPVFNNEELNPREYSNEFYKNIDFELDSLRIYMSFYKSKYYSGIENCFGLFNEKEFLDDSVFYFTANIYRYDNLKSVFYISNVYMDSLYIESVEDSVLIYKSDYAMNSKDFHSNTEGNYSSFRLDSLNIPKEVNKIKVCYNINYEYDDMIEKKHVCLMFRKYQKSLTRPFFILFNHYI